MQVQQRVHLNGGFALAEPGPGEQRETEVDGGRVQRIQALIQIHPDWITSIQWSCDSDQHLGEVRIDAPVVTLVGVGQRGA